MKAKPNILLVMSDEHRGDWLGFLGKIGVRTPNIDALARRGLAFTQAICPSPLCAPSRAAFATGQSYDRCPVKTNSQDLPATSRTVYGDLRTAGYHVSTFGKLDLFKASGSWGADGRHAVGEGSKLVEIGFDAGCDNGGKHEALTAYRSGRAEPYTHYLSGLGLAQAHSADYARRAKAAAGTISPQSDGHDAFFLDTEPTTLPDEAYCDNWIGRGALDLLSRVPPERPWFMHLNFCGPHEPMDVTSAMKERWENVDLPVPDEMSGLTAAHHRDIRRNYAAMIENIDGWVGRLIDFLDASGQRDDTIVVYASDHGEMLGDRGMWEKHVPWQASIHVPLIVAGGEFAGGVSVAQPVSLLDLTATIRTIAGVEAPDGVEGVALQTLTNSDAGGHRVVTSGLGNWRLAFDGRYKLVVGYDPALPRRKIPTSVFELGTRSSLYDLVEDPAERHDIALSRPDIVDRLSHHIGGVRG